MSRKPIYIFLLILTSDCNAWPQCACCAAAATFFSFLSSFLCSARFNPLLHHLNLLMLDFYQNTAVYPAIQVLMYLHTQQRCIACEGKKEEAAVAEVLLQKCRQWRNSVIRSTAKKGTKGGNCFSYFSSITCYMYLRKLWILLFRTRETSSNFCHRFGALW